MPSWENSGLGTMKRAALWLVQVVGEGEVFTKSQLREAFPDVSQIDRRMRDLRDFNWQINTNREDLTLDQHEQRFVSTGDPVWEPGKGTKKGPAAITAAQRRELLARDSHMCRSCGIGAGQTFDDTHDQAQLDVARRKVGRPDGGPEVQLVIECNRCRVGGRGLVADPLDLQARIGRLPAFDRNMLAQWIQSDERPFSEVEILWAAYRALPAASRDAIREALA
jgi:hypothetical protein